MRPRLMHRKPWGSVNFILMLVGAIALMLGSVCWAYDYWQKERFVSYWLNRLPLEETSAPALPSPAFTSQIPTTTPTPVPSPTPRPRLNPVPTFTPGSPTPTPTLTPLPTPARMPPPAYIVIPKIGVDAPVVEVGWKVIETEEGVKVQWETADYAAGHHFNSANPGEGGNVVISGHHNIKGKVFNGLWELEPGDEIYLQNSEGEVFVYKVKEVLLLKEKGVSEEERRAHARYMDPRPEETLTLISCWPPWGNAYRVVVIARPAERRGSSAGPQRGRFPEAPPLR